MFGLADCNNFYASCERVFNPSLRNLPVIILSNNDGCVIARSNEVKALGIKMGVPAFEIKDEIKKNNIKVFSSNYVLYGDMSHRVMSTLSEYVPEIEIYSIDEAFMDFSGFENFNLEEYARKIVKETFRNTGIPISLGIAPTKTLAKVANKIAKKNILLKSAYVLDTKEKIHNALASFPVEDVWGIGRKYAAFLKNRKINTALDFISMPKSFVQKNMTVVGARLWDELQGEVRHELEYFAPDKQSICTSRSFGNMLTDAAPIEEAVANYAVRCAEKLRKQDSCAGIIMVFIHTNQHRKDLKQYAKHIVITLPVATNSSIELTQYAISGLRRIFKTGYHYKKAGVIVSDIIPETYIQQNLFDNVDRSRHTKLMNTMDKINNSMGRDKIRLASQGFGRKWKLKQEQLSPCYTTRMSDILTINI